MKSLNWKIFSGWRVAEALDAAMLFWLLVKSISDGKEITGASGVGELFLPKLLLGRMFAEDLFRNADNPPCGGHG